MINPTRRGFLGLLTGTLAAPLIVRATNIMPVKAIIDDGPLWEEWIEGDIRPLFPELHDAPILGYRRAMMSIEEFRKIVEPELNKAFDEIYKSKSILA